MKRGGTVPWRETAVLAVDTDAVHELRLEGGVVVLLDLTDVAPDGEHFQQL